ncbi:hypothetical protein R1flu_022612 [Riccia fluitans]|uniref:Uncharacterized protein n=1 Tax=Riccia fluitans TaxID=41844 RepID=A0ABD1XPR0_9MARC
MKWLSPEDEKKLGFVRDVDEEAKDKEPSSPKADKVRVEAKEVPQVETLPNAPEEDEPIIAEPIPDEEDPNIKVEPKQRRSKRRQSSPLIPTNKPKARRKTKMTKKDMIDISEEEPQEAKREEEM